MGFSSGADGPLLDPQELEQELDRLVGAAFVESALPMCVTALDHRMLRVNDAFGQMVGRPAAELRGQPYTAITHPEDRPASRRHTSRVAEAGRARSLEKRYLRADGTIVWGHLTTTPLRDRSGRIIALFSQVRDVTAARALQDRLRRLSHLHGALVETGEAMIRATTEQELFQAACDIAVRHGELRMAWVGRIDPGTGDIRPAAAAGVQTRFLKGIRVSALDTPEGQGPSGLAVRTGRHDVRQDLLADPTLEPWQARSQRAGFRSVAAFPLRVGATVRGTLVVYAGVPGFFDDEVAALLDRLAASISFAWEALERLERERQALAELAWGSEQARLTFEQTSVPLATVDTGGRFLQVNRAFGALVGWPVAELVGREVDEVLHPEEREQVRARMTAILGEGAGEHRELRRRLRRRDGRLVWFEGSAARLLGRDQQQPVLVVQGVDITARVEAEALAAQRAAQQAAVAELGREALAEGDLARLLDRAVAVIAQGLRVEIAGVLELDPGGDTLRLRAATGLPAALLHGTTVPAGPGTPAGYALRSTAPVVVDDLEAETRFDGVVALRQWGARSGVSQAIRAGERPWGVLSAYTTVPREFAVDEVHFLEGVANVLSAAVVRQRAEQEVQRQALHDALTGLPNRILLQDRLDVALGRLLRDPRHLAAMLLDLDRFQVVNDSLGHQAGDEVLVRLASRVRAALRPSDTLARVGGDEFVLVCEQMGGADEAVGVARRVLELLAEPMDIQGQEVVVTASLGIAITIDPAASTAQLLQEAGAAMYHAKSGGGARLAVFDNPMRSRFANRIRVETDLRHAVARGEIVCHYQPVVALASGAVVGAEALVRWAHPTRGLVPPADFVPLAEEVGEITRIGLFVLQEACRATARWAAMRDAPLGIAVNLSVRQLQDPGLVPAVALCLADTGLPPADLCLEITETSVIVDSRSAVSVLAQLKALGVAIAVDDFGTGYSSVSHLRRFALDQLKIDRSFVTGLATDAQDLALVDGVVKLAHSLGLTTSAEGVETAEQLAVLRRLGCDYAQGFLMARPLPPAAFEALWLSGRTW